MSRLSNENAFSDARFEASGELYAVNATDARRQVRLACENLGINDIRSVTVTIRNWVRTQGEKGPGTPLSWDFEVVGYAKDEEIVSESEGADSLGIHT